MSERLNDIDFHSIAVGLKNNVVEIEELLISRSELINRSKGLDEAYQELRKSFKIQNNSAVRGWEKAIRLEKRNERYKQALESILTEDDFEDAIQQIERITTIASEALEGEG